MEPRYDTRGGWTVTVSGTSSAYYPRRNYDFRTIFDRENRVDLRYEYQPFYIDMNECFQKAKSDKKEDWSKSKEVDEFLEGFEVK